MVFVAKVKSHQYTKHFFTQASPLSKTVFEVIKPIYEDLSIDNLLNRCLGGFTQNNNESFNATVWSMPAKTRSSGKNVLVIAGNLAVCSSNDGVSSVMQVIGQLDMTVGCNCYNFCVEADELRIDFSDRSLTEAEKNCPNSLEIGQKRRRTQR